MGCRFNVQYSLGKGLDNTPLLTQLTVQAESGRSDPSNLDRDLGPNPLDIRHNFNGNIVYLSENHASNAFVRQLLNGNQIGVLLQFNSGLPVNISSTGRDLNGDGVASDRPLFVSRNSLYLAAAQERRPALHALRADPRVGARGNHRRAQERVQHRADLRHHDQRRHRRAGNSARADPDRSVSSSSIRRATNSGNSNSGSRCVLNTRAGLAGRAG